MIKGQARSRDMPVQMYLGNAQSWDKPCKVLETSHLLEHGCVLLTCLTRQSENQEEQWKHDDAFSRVAFVYLCCVDWAFFASVSSNLAYSD